MKLHCNACEKIIFKKRSNTLNRFTNKRYRTIFCNQNCRNKWLHQRHLRSKRKIARFIRKLWGTTPLKRFQAKYAIPFGRKAEKRAMIKILPKLGFKNIINFTNWSSQFYIDFVAFYKGKRVLIDATIKLTAWIPGKIKLANALGMDLFIIHVSPSGKLFWLKKIPKNEVTSKVPMAFIRKYSKIQRRIYERRKDESFSCD